MAAARSRSATGRPEATNDYRAEQDVVGEFLDECCEVDRTAAPRTTASELYRRYTAWAEDSSAEPISQKAFGTALTERGFERRKVGGRRVYVGVQLKDGAGGDDDHP